MAKGKKTDYEVQRDVIAVHADTRNAAETGRRLKMPASTVKGIVSRAENDPSLVELRRDIEITGTQLSREIVIDALERLKQEIAREDKDIPINHLASVIDKLVDKIMIIEGKPTGNVAVEIKLPEGVDVYAE